MGTRPCPPGFTNPAVPCDCSSTFTVNQNATVRVQYEGQPSRDVTGTLSFNGSICSNCNNEFSDFTLTFVDTDLTDGNQSFSFIPTSIQPIRCSTRVLEGIEYFVQDIIAVGIVTLTGQSPSINQVVDLSLYESTVSGLDDRIIFVALDRQFNAPVIFDIFVPDNSLTVTDCP
jgi:hypothetical protein